MPYIKEIRRVFLSRNPEDLNSAGELNYLFTELAKLYISKHGLNYNTINDIVGALEGAKLEFYRRVAAPYEGEKISQNGDVYDF